MADLKELIVTRADELADFCTYLANCDVFGFDTEFVGEDTYHPSLCLVQVAAGDRLYLLDPLSVGPLESFWRLVMDPARVSVVHAGREEVRLCRLGGGAPPGNLFDLQLAAGLAGHAYPLSHGALVSQILGVQIAKGETLTEWRSRPLTPEQIRYAFDDVRHLLPARAKLAARLERLGRVQWANEEFARLADSTAREEPTNERWRKLRGLGSLDRRKLAVVRALYYWRDEVAARTNRPPRTIVRDDLLVEIARRNPAKERDLQVVRGLPKRDLEPIVQTVLAARALPASECPEPADRDQDPPQVGLVTNVLMAVLGDSCARNQLASNLVASTADVKLLVRARLAGDDLPARSILTRGWRAQNVLPRLRAVLEGRQIVRIADVAAEAPFEFEDVSPAPLP
jgi:ribonuclease D